MSAAYSELDRLQQQCSSIRAEMSGGLLAVDQRLQALRNEHDKLMSDVEKLRRDNQEAFAHQLEAIVSCEHSFRISSVEVSLKSGFADKDYVITRVGNMATEVAL